MGYIRKSAFLRILFCFLLIVCLLVGCGDSKAPEQSSQTTSSQNSSSQPSVSTSSSDQPQSSSSESSSAVSSSTGSSSSTATLPVDNAYFDDAVFVGDSVTLKLQYYVMNKRQSEPDYLGQAQFLASGSLGWANALWEISSESVHPSYKGTKMLIEDAIQQMGAKKVYIMLGVNDIGLYGVDDTLENAKTLLGRILEKNPDAQLFVQSVTPMVKGKELRDLNNTTIKEFDDKLQAYCQQAGYTFVDVASVMRDSEGYLPLEYCSDPSGENSLGIHFTDTACEKWIEYLQTPVS